MYHTKVEVDYLYSKIREKMSKNGYSHRLGIHESGNRFELFLLDDTGYHCKEYGRLTIDRAYTFLTAYLEGLNMGLVDFS